MDRIEERVGAFSGSARREAREMDGLDIAEDTGLGPELRGEGSLEHSQASQEETQVDDRSAVVEHTGCHTEPQLETVASRHREAEPGATPYDLNGEGNVGLHPEGLQLLEGLGEGSDRVVHVLAWLEGLDEVDGFIGLDEGDEVDVSGKVDGFEDYVGDVGGASCREFTFLGLSPREVDTDVGVDILAWLDDLEKVEIMDGVGNLLEEADGSDRGKAFANQDRLEVDGHSKLSSEVSPEDSERKAPTPFDLELGENLELQLEESMVDINSKENGTDKYPAGVMVEDGEIRLELVPMEPSIDQPLRRPPSFLQRLRRWSCSG